MKNILYLILFLLVSTVIAQDNSSNNVLLRNCATMDVYDRLKLEDPTYEERLNNIESEIREYLKNNPQFDNVVITIPVVVHVVYKTSAENISTAQIQSQINILNLDFRKLNSDINLLPPPFQPLAADCQINFCMATRDPNGNVTTGITRTHTNKNSFRTNDDVKKSNRGGKDAWPRDQYLNIWVCNLSGGVLGYAQFPGGPAATDGIVNGYKYFGNTGAATYPFDKGRTATHEIGHWLNLRHIWGDDGSSCSGSDLVDDTPNQAGYNFGCPPFPRITCSNGPNGDLHMNYMDYTDDRCMYMFSNGQSSRMTSILNGTRSTILTSNGCLAPTFYPGQQDNNSSLNGPNSYRLFQNFPNPFNPSTTISYSIPYSSFVTVNIYDASGKVVATLVNELQSSGNYSLNFDASNLSSGIYFFDINAGNFTDTKKMVLMK